MIVLAQRNMKIFFRDKANVFFSMLVVLLTLGLYMLFLGDNLTAGFTGIANARALVDKWLIAGLLATASLTTTLGAFGIMVRDRESKIDKDFLAAPISNAKRVAGYLSGTFMIGLIMTSFTLLVGQLYFYFSDYVMFTMTEFLMIFGIMLLSVLSSTAMMYMIVEMFRSPMAYETVVSIISTLIGFLAGIYIPLGVLPRFVQYIGILFPVTHGASLLRQVMMRGEIAIAFNGAPAEALHEFEVLMGNVFVFGDTEVTPWMSVGYLLLMTLVFYAGAVVLSKRKKK